MEIVDNKALILRTRDPNKYSIIPKHKVLGHEDGIYQVAVYWGLDESRVLKNLGVKDVPSPIKGRYGWPGKYKPMDHQIETAAFLTLHRRAFCFNDPGTGKTLSALWAADYLIERGEVRRVLVLCPLSIMHSAWMGDIMNSTMHRSAIVAHHQQAARRIEMIQRDYEIVIANYDGLNLIADEIRNDGRFDLVIVDEANAYKNPSTRRWKALASIIKPETYLWMMTGTPASQSPVDAYGLAKLVNPSGVPKFQTAWRDKVMNKITMFKWTPKDNARSLVYEALQPAIRFTKGQCLDLPPVITVTREVPMTPQQNKYYRMLKEQMMVRAAGETISAVNAGVAVNKLLQISCGAAYTDDKEVVEFDASPRLHVLDEVLEETERKVIIFALFRSSIDTIVTHLTKQGYAVGQIHGDVSASKRGQIIADFQSSLLSEKDVVDKGQRDILNGMRAQSMGCRVLVMQPQATAHGITLTAADTVVFFGPLMSVEMYTQCIARADRKGQNSDKVTVVHIESSPIEKKLFKAMDGKVTDHKLLVDMFDSEVKNI
jgi:superfamily II DNA or RNA helicase